MARGNKFASFIQGVGIGQRLYADYQSAKDRHELAAISKAKPVQSDGFTTEDGQQLEAIANAKDADGKPYYALKANPDGSYAVTDNANPSQTGVIAQRGVTDFLGQRTAGKMDDGQVMSARQQAMAGVLMKTDPAQGMRMMRDITHGQRDDQRFGWEKARAEREQRVTGQADADAADLRAALNSGTGAAQLPGTLALGGMDATGGGESVGATAAARARGGLGLQRPGSEQAPAVDDYLKTVAPGVMKTLIGQGKLEEAKRFQGFVESNEGRAYARAWTDGVRRHAIGDHEGALRSFERMYNEQMFGDGQTIKLTPEQGGKAYRAEIFGPDGQSIGSQTASTAELANQALLFMEPTRAMELHAQQQSKRQTEAALLERQTKLEELRQQGRESSEDRRDARLVKQIEARRDKPRGGLTAAQERSNLEIDAAREKLAGLDPAEIRRRTAKTTDTGRENKDFDPSLARAAALAQRRKIGDDEDFDAREPVAKPSAAAAQDAASRFKADPAMSKYRLGKQTAQGIEVLDAYGKLLGHYD